MTIFPAGSLNVAALRADDLYVQVLNPPSYIRGTPTDVFAAVGTASWGPVDTPVLLGSGQDAVTAFGPISSLALSDPYDLATDLALAFGQASSVASLEGYGVRVTDGTDTKAAGSVVGTASPAAKTVTIGGTITADDTVSVVVTDSSVTGSPFTVTYTVVTGDTLTTIAAALAALIEGVGALTAVGFHAVSVGAVLSVYAPSGHTYTVGASVSSGATETATTGTGSTSTAGATITALFTGTSGNNITMVISAGGKSGTYNVNIIPFQGLSELYPNIPGTLFWKNLHNAINSGLGTYRGPSSYLRVTAFNAAVAAPTLGTYTLSGGTDGRANVVTADLLGSDSAAPRTGLYSLRNLNPAVSAVWVTGCTDQVLIPSLIQLAESEGMTALFPFASGTSSASAVSQAQTLGYHSSSFIFTWNWLYFYDQVNAQTRLVPPNAVLGGRLCTLTPEQSLSNKNVYLVLGTERSNQYTGSLPFSLSEIGSLEQAGVMFIMNPIPAGSIYGVRHGLTTSLDEATQPVEWWRMTSYLARSLNASMGQFVGRLQSQRADDPLRLEVRTSLNTFLETLKGLQQIDDYRVNCDFSTASSARPGLGMNTPASVAQHYLYVLVQVRYLSSVRFFVVSLQGGTTVVTVGSQIGQQVAANQ